MKGGIYYGLFTTKSKNNNISYINQRKKTLKKSIKASFQMEKDTSYYTCISY